VAQPERQPGGGPGWLPSSGNSEALHELIEEEEEE
jgi:hypothetical protein